MNKTIEQLLATITAEQLILAILLIILLAIIAYNWKDKIKDYFTSLFKKWKKREEFQNLVYDNHDRLAQLEEQRKIDVEQSIKHDQALRDSVDNIAKQVGAIVDKLDDMQKKNTETELAKLKDKIHQSYRYYRAKKEWTVNEKEAFLGLISEYYKLGGNSFVEKEIEPECYTWKIIL